MLVKIDTIFLYGDARPFISFTLGFATLEILTKLILFISNILNKELIIIDAPSTMTNYIILLSFSLFLGEMIMYFIIEKLYPKLEFEHEKNLRSKISRHISQLYGLYSIYNLVISIINGLL